MCPHCNAALPPSGLSCPSCGQLVHAAQLEGLAERAKLAERAGDAAAARAAWAEALPLLPPETLQYRKVQALVDALDARLATAAAEHHDRSQFARWTARFGPAAVVLWKFKAGALFLLAKGKLLVLGLTKLSTFTSMLASFGLYWTWYGWKFALGFVLSIYIHEMGHVIALRKYNIAASAPMFIPFLGAFVRLRQYPSSPAEDARVGLAGPIYGLGAAVVAWLAAITTGQPIWYAIAYTGAWINLFNLIPVWQLDGGRGFRALTRKQRGMALGVIVAMWALTQESMLLFVGAGAIYRLFTHDYPADEDNGALVQYAGLIVLLAMLVLMCSPAHRLSI